MSTVHVAVGIGVLAVLCFALPVDAGTSPAGLQVGRVNSADGVEIVYRVQGNGEPALVFIHGGFADWTFWSNQIGVFAKQHKVIAVDLAGHGESGKNRTAWTAGAFSNYVLGVMAKERVGRAIVIGNSLGCPVAMEVAKALGEKVLGVVAVDSLQNMKAEPPADYFEKLAESYRKDYQGTLRGMIDSLFHKDCDPAIRAPLEKIMLATGNADNVASLMKSWATYEYPTISQPIRCINGDLYPTDVALNRTVHADFDAAVLTHAGHYPQVERPQEFNDLLAKYVAEMTRSASKK